MTRDHDKEHEHRIYYEIIVDAYDEYEQAMGWLHSYEGKFRVSNASQSRAVVKQKKKR